MLPNPPPPKKKTLLLGDEGTSSYKCDEELPLYLSAKTPSDMNVGVLINTEPGSSFRNGTVVAEEKRQ